MDGKLYKKLQEVISDCLLEDACGNYGTHQNEESYFNTMAAKITSRLDKIDIAVIDNSLPEKEIETPILIGHLTTRWGVRGYVIAEPGHEVYEYQGGYQIEIVSETPDKLANRIVKFRKENLTPVINFLNK